MSVSYSSPQQTDVMVELHVPDFHAVKNFYNNLGFRLVWERKPMGEEDGYMVMRMGASVLNFHGGTQEVVKHEYFGKFPHNTKRGYAIEIIIPIDGVEGYYKKVQGIYPDYIVKPLWKKYSHADFRMEDINGFYIRFIERYNWVVTRDKDGKSIV